MRFAREIYISLTKSHLSSRKIKGSSKVRKQDYYIIPATVLLSTNFSILVARPSFLTLVPNITLNPLNYRSSIKERITLLQSLHAAIKTRYPTRKNVTKGMQEVTLQEVSQFLTALPPSLSLSRTASLSLFSFIKRTSKRRKQAA